MFRKGALLRGGKAFRVLKRHMPLLFARVAGDRLFQEIVGRAVQKGARISDLFAIQQLVVVDQKSLLHTVICLYARVTHACRTVFDQRKIAGFIGFGKPFVRLSFCSAVQTESPPPFIR